jgi:hypothetical protein
VCLSYTLRPSLGGCHPCNRSVPKTQLEHGSLTGGLVWRWSVHDILPIVSGPVFMRETRRGRDLEILARRSGPPTGGSPPGDGPPVIDGPPSPLPGFPPVQRSGYTSPSAGVVLPISAAFWGLVHPAAMSKPPTDGLSQILYGQNHAEVGDTGANWPAGPRIYCMRCFPRRFSCILLTWPC